jgi:GNAT superfamily N-acetyltransferase
VCQQLELVTGRVLRPSVPEDARRLVAMYERCSSESRYARFLAPLDHFPASHLVDVVRSTPIRRSWVVHDLDTGHVVGVGSWFRTQVHVAEIGLLVEDAFQRQGQGTALLDAVAESARNWGVRVLLANTLRDSRHVHRMLHRIGPTCMDCQGFTCELHVALSP